MHIQIVTFHLMDLSTADYRGACDGLAEAFADVPGLIAKIWLANEPVNTYGGVYTWRDRGAMEAYLHSDLFRAIVTNPHLVDLSSADFDVLEGPTRVTAGRVAVEA